MPEDSTRGLASERTSNPTCPRRSCAIASRPYGKRRIDRAKSEAASADYSAEPAAAHRAARTATTAPQRERLDEAGDRVGRAPGGECAQQSAVSGPRGD